MRLVYKTLVPIVFIIGATLVVGGFFFRDSLENTLIQEQYLKIRERVVKNAQVYLKTETFDNPYATSSKFRFQVLSETIKDTTVARISFWNPQKTIVYSDLSSVVGVSSPSQEDVARAFQEGRPFFLRRESDTHYPTQSVVGRFVDIYIPIHIGGELLTVVQIHSVLEAILAPLDRGIANAFLGLLVSVLVVIVVVFLVFRIFVLSPLEKLGGVAKRISNGNFTKPVVRVSKDEMGELFSSIDIMRERLQSLVGGLEKKVEERTHELQEEETRLSASLGSLSVGFAIIDTGKRVFYSNEALKNILKLGATPKTLGDISRVFGNACDIESKYEDAIEHRKSFDTDKVLLGRTALRVFIAPVIMRERNEVLGVVLLIDDITEAKVVDRSKEEFLSIASHELRTPLTAIRANAALLKDFFTKGNAEAGEIAEDIHAASLRLIKIVHDFLEVSKLEQKMVVKRDEEIDISNVVKGVIEELKTLTLKKGLNVSYHEDPSLPHGKGDIDRFRQVVTNLVGNAINYTEKGSVEISAVVEEKGVTVFVKDTGIGIPPERQSLLFRKFQQAGESIMTRDQSQSTGLGLYISHLIMEGMGGKVELRESTKGQGSTFSVTIPR
jgi:signal transduction histidine kinase/HAMP domain-containing protein